jgi:hypothetical protein
MRAKQPRASPMLPIHSDTRRAYWRVVMPGVRAATTREQEFAGPVIGGLQIIIDGLARLFAQFESDRPPVFFCRTVCAT